MESVFAAGRDAAEALYQAAIAVVQEEADDEPARQVRERAAAELRGAVVATMRRFRNIVHLAATDETGVVIHPVAVDSIEALSARFLPDGNLGGVALDGPALQVDARSVRDAIAGHPFASHATSMIHNLDRLLDHHAKAVVAVAQEAAELRDVRQQLEEARDNAIRLRRAVWLYLQFVESWQEIDVNLKSVFPSAPDAVTPDAPPEPVAPAVAPAAIV